MMQTGYAQYNVPQSVSLLSVEVSLMLRVFQLFHQLLPFFFDVLELPHIFFLHCLLLPSMPSRSLRVALSLFVRLSGRLRVVYLHRYGYTIAWQCHVCLLPLEDP